MREKRGRCCCSSCPHEHPLCPSHIFLLLLLFGWSRGPSNSWSSSSRLWVGTSSSRLWVGTSSSRLWVGASSSRLWVGCKLRRWWGRLVSRGRRPAIEEPGPLSTRGRRLLGRRMLWRRWVRLLSWRWWRHLLLLLHLLHLGPGLTGLRLRLMLWPRLMLGPWRRLLLLWLRRLRDEGAPIVSWRWVLILGEHVGHAHADCRLLDGR